MEEHQRLQTQGGGVTNCPKKRRVRLPVWRNISTCTNRVVGLHCPKKRRVRLPVWRNINICTNRVEVVTLSHKEEGEAARLEEHQHLHKQSIVGLHCPIKRRMRLPSICINRVVGLHCPIKRRVRLPVWRIINICPKNIRISS